jgi:serine/threonine protein kinase
VEAQQLLNGRYRLEARIGQGGMSVVWRASDEVLRRHVAVKVLAGALATDPAARLRIQAEARAAARLAHPHVASVYDYGVSADADGEPEPFVVMELLRGPTLGKRLAGGPIPVPEALRICAEVASGIAAAHEEGLVHRDVKPSNVVLAPSGAKVVDFGIAAAAGPLEDLDESSRMVGTPAYLAPERVIGGDVMPASDVYAVGLLLHAVLTGRLPWRVETTTQMLKAHVYVQPEPMQPVPGVPRHVIEPWPWPWSAGRRGPARRPPSRHRRRS